MLEREDDVVAVIPARSGSKRIPNKNVLEINNKPMIAWVIETLKSTNVFNKIYVSTDSQSYANISKSFGAEVPFLRSETLSNDFTTSDEVVADFVQELGLRDSTSICCIYPTSILVERLDILTSYQLHIENLSSYLLSIAEFPHPIQRALKQLNNGQIAYVDRNYSLMRTQDIENHYYDAGQFYWATASIWRKFANNEIPNMVGYKLDRTKYIDIDYFDSLTLASCLHKMRLQKNED